MTSTTLIQSRDSLITHVATRLHDFERELDRFFKEVQVMVSHPQTVIINGQRINYPAQYLPVTLEVECRGEGELISEDGSSEKFELIHFAIKNGHHEQGIGVSVYYGHHDEFDRHLYEFFNI